MIAYASYTDIGGRFYNEDTVGFSKEVDGQLCAVLADGLGGHGGGKEASKEAVSRVLEGWNPSVTTASMYELVQKAHCNIVSMQTPACRMKTTIVVLAVGEKKAKWLHAGDSRLYHFVDGQLVFQTRDHSISQIAVMMQEIKPEELRFHEDRSRIFRALGQEDGVNPDVGEQALCAGHHAFLLCTDGFWEYVYEKEMEQALRASTAPQEWLDRMQQLLKGRADGNHDNNTAAAVWLEVKGEDVK